MTSTTPDDERRSISVSISKRDLIKLEQLARRDRRTPRDQAAVLLLAAIADAELEAVA